MRSTTRMRKCIEAAGMTLVEYAKDCLRKELHFSEAYAIDLMTSEEREEYGKYRTAYINECLKDCPF